MMKAKAETEAKEMQAKGLKRGEDFVDCESPLCLLFMRMRTSVARPAIYGHNVAAASRKFPLFPCFLPGRGAHVPSSVLWPPRPSSPFRGVPYGSV